MFGLQAKSEKMTSEIITQYFSNESEGGGSFFIPY